MSTVPDQSSYVALAGNLDTVGDGHDVPSSRLVAINAAITALNSAMTAANYTLSALGTAARRDDTDFDGAGAASAVLATSLQKASNLSDLNNAATARTNLGLGTAATSASSAFDAAGAASTVNTALTTHAGLAAAHGATGAVVGTTNTQVLTNKTIQMSGNALSMNTGAGTGGGTLSMDGGAITNAGNITIASGTETIGSLTTSSTSFSAREASLVFNRKDLTSTYLNRITNSWSATPVNSTMNLEVTNSIGTTTPVLSARGDGSVMLAFAGTTTSITLSSPANDLVLSSSGQTSQFRLLPFGSDIYFDNNAAGDLYFRSNQTAGAVNVLYLKYSDKSATIYGLLNVPHVVGKSAGSLTYALFTGSGTGGGYTAAGTDAAGSVTVTAGTSPQINQPVVTATFGTAYTAAPYVVISPANAAAAALSGFYVTSTTTGFTINAGAGALTNAGVYKWTYLVIG